LPARERRPQAEALSSRYVGKKDSVQVHYLDGTHKRGIGVDDAGNVYLNETGLIEGQNIALDYRWAEGQYDRLAGLAADLVRQQVTVIVTMGGDLSAQAAKTASATIPIVFAIGFDPIRSGLVTSLHRPGGNITGVSTLLAEIEPKRLALLRELRPHATTTAVLVNSENIPRAEAQVSDLQTAARSVRQEITADLFCTNCFIPRFDLGLVVQNHVQQGIMDFQFAVVFDKTQFAEPVHEKAYA
jgi:hypothetical protein